MSQSRATARFVSDHDGPPPLPVLHEAYDNGRVAIFDPVRISDESCWIQCDSDHVIDQYSLLRDTVYRSGGDRE